MIIRDGHQVSEIHWHGKAITAVYTAMKEVWRAVSSCFGSGYWIDDLVWDDNDIWKD